MSRRSILVLCMAMVLSLTACAGGSQATKELTEQEMAKGNQSLEISCHDPQIIEVDGTYYMTGSHMVLAKSTDLMSWDYISNGNAKNYISNLYSGDLEAFSYVGKNDQGGYSVWAGNIFYNPVMEKYCLYFCTSSTYIRSTLALAVSDTPEGPYTYTDTLLYSGFSKKEVADTNLYDVLGADGDIDHYFKYGGYDNNRWPNCIDPAIYIDADGRYWMVYGSWSGGIFELELDPTTGLPIHPTEDASAGVDAYFGYHLIGGGHHACEGAYMYYNPSNQYYYLFVSYGNLQREGGYQVRQFRSTSPTGPFVDAAGNTLEDEDNYYDFGVKMMGNYDLPSLEWAYMAPGGQSVFSDTAGNLCMVYHQRFDQGTEYHEPRVHTMHLDANDWYTVAPFAYRGDEEAATNLTTADMAGTVYLLNHETDVSNVIHRAEAYTFAADGSVTGEADGNFCVLEDTETGTLQMQLTLGDINYCGPVFLGHDEAENKVLYFMSCNDKNETIWGVKYLQEN